MKILSIITLFLCVVFLSADNPNVTETCDGDVCTYTFPIPVNVTTIDLATENQTLLSISDNIENLTRYLTSAMISFSNSSDATAANLTDFNVTIIQLNNDINNLVASFQNELLPAIDTLTNNITQLNHTMVCFQTCPATSNIFLIYLKLLLQCK